MNSVDSIVSQAAHKRAALVFHMVTCKITAALGSAWLPGDGNQLLDEIRNFCRDNLASLARRQFALKLRCGVNPQGGATLTPSLIGKLRKADSGIPLIEVSNGLTVISVNHLTPKPDEDSRNAITDASAGCAIFYYEHDKLCSIWAQCQRISELSPANWLRVGIASTFSRDAADYNEAAKDHYRNEVKHGQRLNHWMNENDRILKRADPPKLSTTESIFHHSLATWLQLMLPPHSVSVKDAEKGSGDCPDILIADFGRTYVIEVKWMGTNGSTKYSWSTIWQGIRQSKRYAERSPQPESTCVIIYDGRDLNSFESFKEQISEEGIAEFEEYQGEVMPANGICYILYLHSGSASKNAKTKK
ncbi:hypothetical protein SAMN02745166_01416 [Prosthecobacter debontii]|uniref:Uncharacterized protein n=1 Tax=Prosthecobacter debontii TaxID=48467 RepID=A0A1T4XFS1_9BACT|nr:hypothetical protein [Prosthecobacter debontii]SKA88434.1 hypothetical protein SAMN02745166_01416 [Prosthecobacter debontii]